MLADSARLPATPIIRSKSRRLVGLIVFIYSRVKDMYIHRAAIGAPAAGESEQLISQST